MPAMRMLWHQPFKSIPIQVFTFLGAVLLTTRTGLASDSELIVKGQALSKRHCARCHIVSEDDRFTGISSTPSFKIMIEDLGDWENRFQTFLARNPHPAHIRLEGDAPRPENLPATTHEVILSQNDVEAILAYVDSMAVELRKKGK